MAELIRRQRTPLRSPTREQTAAGPVAEPLGEPGHQAPPRPSNRAARIASLSTGALVLLVSIAAASIMVGNRDSGPLRPTPAPPAEIAGSAALRPDVLSAQLAGPRDAPATPVPEPSPMGIDLPLDVAAEPDSHVVPPREAATRSKPQVDVVRHFYELLPAKPAEAVLLLTPGLVGGNARDFVTSWGGVQAITIESTTLRPDGTVLAAVSMQERSGRWLRVEQRFWLSDTSPPRIVRTDVLSAQRG
ncbi:hypothetical protein ABZ816_21060 [Actinosynnema sp. NPDC047251]|uniref:hypothetical protein n=1 Tax=Saccharothrix espanaensis TaxID=103731 RepID=UPI00031CF494|nr:hypothetical protein [Saccharothrix espanaensis]